jgi:CheY-like chemotaxis protein/two-component sensor histidine kinase
LESVGTLASGIAHDFNNLLGAILGQAELALSELQSGLRPEQELRQIREVAIHGADIVRQLMIHAGKENQIVEPVNLSQFVGEMLELLRLSVSKSVTLETELDQQLPSVKVNPAQLRQILMNLVTNASEAIGTRTGVIRLTTEVCSLDRPAALAAGLAEGHYVRLLAADNGRGMSAETQARAFDPFFTTKSAGRGLGLAVVHGIVRSLGGAIRIESKPEEGTTFDILLPCCDVAAPLTAASAAPNGDFLRLHESAAVLIVEDEDALRQGIAKQLRKIGFDVFEAGNGTAAIDLLHAHGTEIDAILLDMTIPGHSSADVLAEAAMIRPTLKVLLTSAYTEEMVTKGLESPLVLGFIRKPFQLTTLLQQLRGILANS